MRTGILSIAISAVIFSFVLRAAAQQGSESWAESPDLILHASSDRIVRDAPADPFTDRFEISGGASKDHWIRAVEFHPGEPEAVRSAFFYIDKTGQWLGSWAPGEKMVSFPETVAALLPAMSKVILEVHYQTIPDENSADSSLALYFADRKPLRPLTEMGVETRVEVPATGERVTVKKEFMVISDSYAIAVRPEMQTSCRSLEVTMLDPSGRSEVLLSIPDFTAEQVDRYLFEQPVLIPKGSRIVATAAYQNSGTDETEDLFKLSVSMYPSNGSRPVSYAPAKKAPVRKAPVRKAPAKKTPAKKPR
jgi:hypothetical protein